VVDFLSPPKKEKKGFLKLIIGLILKKSSMLAISHSITKESSWINSKGSNKGLWK